jgi:HK97 family phage prohead protease
MTTKSMTTQFKLRKDDAGDPTGEVEFYASKFGNVDLVGDRMVKGSFEKSLAAWQEKGAPIPVIFSHKWDDPFALIGYANPSDVKEDDNGLLVKAQLDIKDNPTAMQVWKNMARGTLNEASFAYDVVSESGLKKGRDGANDIYEVDLLEVGPTLKGANPDTVGVLSAKSREAKARAVAEGKYAPMEGSVEQSQADVIQAINDFFGSMPGSDPDDFCVSPYATFSDHIIVCVSDFSGSYSQRYFDFPYTVDDQGCVQLSAATEVEVSTSITPAGKSATKAAAASDSDQDSNERAQTLFDLSDAAHTAIAVAIVFGAADVRDGKPKPQSEWSYRGTNPGADLSASQVNEVVNRVRAAASKFDVPLTAPKDGSKSSGDHGTKAGARHSAADAQRVQSMHDTSCALGATCDQSGDEKSRKAKPSPDDHASPADASDGPSTDPASGDEDLVQVSDSDGNQYQVPRSALGSVNTQTADHEDSDDGDTDPNVDGDGVDSGDEDDNSDSSKSAPAPEVKDYSLALLELDEFVL